MKINEVEQIAGITKKNIRFYEEQGLIHPKRNIGNDYREYSDEDAKLLLKIKLLRKLNIPIEEIRKVIDGEADLDTCLEQHKTFLQKESDNLKIISEMCSTIITQNRGFTELEPSALLDQMTSQERNGAKFVNIKETDVKKKKFGAIASAAIILALVVISLIGIYFANLEDPAPVPVLIIIIIVFVAVIIGLVIALSQRIKEINGGEEDDASNY